MKAQATNPLATAFFVIILLSAGSSEHDLFLKFCGQWRHGGSDSLRLNIDVSVGCSGIRVAANESSLSVKGSVAAKCNRRNSIPLNEYGFQSEEETHFCLHWEPLLDQLMLEIGEANLILCPPSGPAEHCCTDLSPGSNEPEASYGIARGKMRTDLMKEQTVTGYSFNGQFTNCKVLCDQANYSYVKGSQNLTHSCAQSSEIEMKEGYRGETFSVMSDNKKLSPVVFIPSVVKPAMKITSKLSVTFYKSNSLFQVGYKEAKFLQDVVEISVENEIITDLPQPISIVFDHDELPWNRPRKCVSWDTRKDPLKVNWLADGCTTKETDPYHTECLCNHLTYFTVLVQLENKPVRHLLPLTVISSVGCAMSFISCIAVMGFFYRTRRRSKEPSISIHLGLVLSLAALSLLFFFTGVLANVGGERLCTWVGAMLHYALLSSLTWMGIEVFNTFWLVHIVFRPSPRPYVWYLIGFGVPVVPVVILAAIGDIYGKVDVVPEENISDPYHMCWMKVTDQRAMLAHCFTTITILAILVFSGVVMLFLVYREIRTREEWKQNRVAFLSIWGLSCLFGTTWGLTFLNFDPLSDFVLFLSCFLNSFQGFFLMLRFCMLEWIRKQARRSVLGTTSSGSSKQHMLQTNEKS